MSARTGVIGATGAAVERPDLYVGPSADERVGSFIVRTLGRFFEIKPYEDGLSLVLLLGVLAAVAWSVQLAGWLNGPLSQPTVFFAGLTGFLAARHRFRYPVGHLAAFAIGWIVVFWQAGQGADGGDIIETSRDVWERFFLWLQAARDGGISRDPLPFELLLLAAAWIVAYVSSWTLFRFRNVWIPVLLLGTAITMNLSYRQGQYEYTLYIFLALSIVLFAHMTAVQRAIRWRNAGIPFPHHLRLLSIQFGVGLSIAAVLIAAILPLWEPRNDSLHGLWETFKDPFRTFQDDATRLLSGVKGGDSNGLGSFNEVLPFRGAIKLTDDPVMFVDTVFPTLHPGRIYTEYTSQGWLTGPTIEQESLSGDVLARREDLKSRRLIRQRFIPNVDTNWVMPVGSTLSVDLDGVSEILAPVEWILTMVDGELGPLPDDVAEFADDLRDEFLFLDRGEKPVTGRRAISKKIAELSPGTLRVISFDLGRRGTLRALRVGRAGPPDSLEQVSFAPDQTIEALDTYIVDQLISTATDEELNGAGTEYPAWVTDRYLQLPEDLPAPVRSLADVIVSSANAQTPFEKTAALQEFLQRQGYSQAIRGPSPDQDAVSYFLFDTVAEPCPNDGSRNPCVNGQLKGYSQYFGSAMAVMLRAAGVPSRMIAGYAPGDFIPERSQFVIRGTDRHGWAQAYFPGYGWIDVEATPGFTRLSRGTAFSAAGQPPDERALTEGDQFEAEFFPPEDLSAFEAQARLLALQQRNAGAGSGTGFPIVAIVAPIAALLGLLTLGMTAWHFGMGRLSPAERAYVKMNRLGRLAGLRRLDSQTPMEYAGLLSTRMPTITAQAYAVAGGYQMRVYGRRGDAGDSAEMAAAWKRIRSVLLGRTVRRLVRR